MNPAGHSEEQQKRKEEEEKAGAWIHGVTPTDNTRESLCGKEKGLVLEERTSPEANADCVRS
jgi:hypothetical protein